jgi:hypothetical protein
MQMRYGRLGGFLALALGAALTGNAARAIGFTCISADGPGDVECAIGEAQFSATIADEGGGQVSITFANSGPDPSIIADVYIDDDASVFSSIASVENGTGVQFAIGASPGDLPGGNNAIPVFSATAGLTADADPPTGTNGNGADPGESFALIMNLAAGKTFADVEAAIGANTLRFGIHGQGLGTSGDSESFVSGGPPGGVVPEPTAALLFGLGAAFVARRTHRR